MSRVDAIVQRAYNFMDTYYRTDLDERTSTIPGSQLCTYQGCAEDVVKGSRYCMLHQKKIKIEQRGKVFFKARHKMKEELSRPILKSPKPILDFTKLTGSQIKDIVFEKTGQEIKFSSKSKKSIIKAAQKILGS